MHNSGTKGTPHNHQQTINQPKNQKHPKTQSKKLCYGNQSLPHKTNNRISAILMLLNDGYLEKVAVSWRVSDDPKVTQQELLESFKKQHGEYPAWNI